MTTVDPNLSQKISLNVMNVCEVDIRGKAHDPGILSCPPLQGFRNVLKYGTEISKQHRHETDTMDMPAQMNVCIGTDEHQHQLEHIRKEKIFLLLFTVTALLCGALL